MGALTKTKLEKNGNTGMTREVMGDEENMGNTTRAKRGKKSKFKAEEFRLRCTFCGHRGMLMGSEGLPTLCILKRSSNDSSL